MWSNIDLGSTLNWVLTVLTCVGYFVVAIQNGRIRKHVDELVQEVAKLGESGK